MKRSIAFGAGLAALLACSLAHADDSLAKVKQAGKLVIATMPNYPPITYKDPATSKLTGFDIVSARPSPRSSGSRPSGRKSPSPRCCPRSRPSASIPLSPE